MRRALDPRPSTQNVSASATLPAPVGGWNTRDSLAAMPVTDAISMDNWFPEATDVRPRNGSETYASGLNGQVETIFSYANGSRLKLMVAVNGTFQNISTVAAFGTVTNGTIAKTFTSDRWQYRQFSTSGGHFAVAVNGADSRQIFDGTVWFTGTISAYSSSVAAFTNVEVFQRRLFYTESGTLRFAYHTNTEAIGGTVSAFDLGPILDMGGSLTAIGTWTRDGGSGMDDLIAFISNMGQLAVYQGTDPGNASAWSLVGVFKVAAPLSERAMDKMGGELLIGTRAGVLPISAVLSGIVQQPPFTDKIRTSVNEAVALYGDRFGWQLKFVPNANWLLLNVPVAAGNFQQQFVMNTQTNAWCRFKDLYANCWEIHDGDLYFGSNGSVIQSTDAQSDDGSDILVDVRQAATAFGAPGRLKLFRMFRPLINSDGDLPMAADINVDFADTIPTNIPTALPISTAVWDVATWDDYYWADSASPALFWQSCGRLGTYGSVRIKGGINTISVHWLGTDVVFEPGGML